MATQAPPAPRATQDPRAEYTRVYVWEYPVRIFHWLNALCIVVLAVTGYLIGAPPGIASAAEASNSYWFGIIRFIHFVTAYVLLFNLLFRVYWSFVGNRYASWRRFVPLRRTQWREIREVVRVDVLQAHRPEVTTIGHNMVAGTSYFVFFLVVLFQVASGFALYESMSDAWLPGLFAWMVPLFGSDATLRTWHHFAMWFFIVFTAIHLYLVIYHDYVEGRGTTSSMIGGWKFMKPDQLEERAHEEATGRSGGRRKK